MTPSALAMNFTPASIDWPSPLSIVVGVAELENNDCEGTAAWAFVRNDDQAVVGQRIAGDVFDSGLAPLDDYRIDRRRGQRRSAA